MLFWTKFGWNLHCNKNNPPKSFHFTYVILNKVLKMARKEWFFEHLGWIRRALRALDLLPRRWSFAGEQI